MYEHLGIDIGGTSVKMGLVNPAGQIHDFQSFSTLQWRREGNFTGRLVEAIARQCTTAPQVSRLGIGVPGNLSRDRRTLLELPNIPELNGTPLADQLEAYFPTLPVRLENDANAAALGEYYFATEPLPEDYLFVTLGTGVGGAAIIDRRVFTGGDGNSMEIGHVVSRYGRRLESNIGKRGIMNLAGALLNDAWAETLMADDKDEVITGPRLLQAAEKGDALARRVLHEVGEILAEGLVSAIRLLDIKTVIVGGGLSVMLPFLETGMQEVFRHYLTPYYLRPLRVRRAQLGNDAGILGAASLCFDAADAPRRRVC